MRRLFFPTVVVAFFAAFSITAQSNDEKAKERADQKAALIESLAAEIPNLTLPENRAFVTFKLGALLRKSDPERAREMFLASAADLTIAISEAELAGQRNGIHTDLANGGSLRRQLVETVSYTDADLALEILYKTRPASVAKALVPTTPEAGKIRSNNTNHFYLAREENTIEQRLLTRAAEQSPERLLKLLTQALSKPVSHETIGLLRKLHEKDPVAAKEIGEKLSDKMLGLKFGSDPTGNQALNDAMMFVNEFLSRRDSADKVYRLDENRIRSLARNLIGYYLSGGPGVYHNQQVITIAEKLDPTKVAQLKALPRPGGRWNGIYDDPKVASLLSSQSPGREIIAAAKDLTAEQRQPVYQRAISRFASNGEFAEATKFIEETYDAEVRSEMLKNLNNQYVHHLIARTDFAEAERLIFEMPENERFSFLISLAQRVYDHNQKDNKERAERILGQVRAMLPETIENSNDLRKYFQLTTAYTQIDSPDGPGITEQVIPLLNELAGAAQVISPFQGHGNVRKGEFVLYAGSILNNVGFDAHILIAISRKSVPESIRLTNLFSRRELRTGLQLQILETLQ